MTRCVPLLFALILGLSASGQTPAPAPEEKPTADPSAAAKRIKDLGNNEFELGGVKFNSRTRQVRVPCHVNMQEGQIEFALVHETGKTHESILKTAASAVDIQVALLLCNYQPGHDGLFDHETDPTVRKNLQETTAKTKGANNVDLRLEWQKDGTAQSAALRDWMLDAKTKKTPTDFDHWVFNGSMVQASGFSAALMGNFIGVYYDVCAVLNCPSPQNRDDDAWLINQAKVPPVDTAVTLIISPLQK